MQKPTLPHLLSYRSRNNIITWIWNQVTSFPFGSCGCCCLYRLIPTDPYHWDPSMQPPSPCYMVLHSMVYRLICWDLPVDCDTGLQYRHLGPAWRFETKKFVNKLGYRCKLQVHFAIFYLRKIVALSWISRRSMIEIWDYRWMTMMTDRDDRWYKLFW
jgi:hypothetical protein